ncbi:MAG: class I SAM-dependent methyltransferase [Chloroflexi bacterium]|nr:class I SAM-dependent methyltransferase [Chloroflexota bacterium]
MTQPPDNLADVFHVSRDEAYARQAKEEAAYYDQPRMMGIDLESRVTDSYQNEIYTGDEDIPWYETIPNYGSFERGCALGAGGTKQRTRILQQNPKLHLTIYDISKESLAVLDRDLASQFPGRVVTKLTDLNFVELPENSFDLFISSGCLHHLYNLEHVAFQINRSLTPDGYFFLEDYVGEARFQFSEEKKRTFAEAFAEAQSRQRSIRHWRIAWPDLDDWNYSPFEALRSNETLEIFRRYLTEVKVRTAGAIIGLILLSVRPPAPLGRPLSIRDVLLRRVVSFKSWLLREGGSQFEITSKLAKQLLPLDRQVSEAGTLTPTNGFAVYRKRVQN